MNPRLPIVALLATLALLYGGCGEEDDLNLEGAADDPQPIEVIYYVSQPTGARFILPSTPDPDKCGSNGTGIQSPNAQHELLDADGQPRVFEAPHMFVLDNLRQPVRAVFENLSDTVPITVAFVLGVELAPTTVEIPPNECRTVGRIKDDPHPQVSGNPARVEACSPAQTPSGFVCENLVELIDAGEITRDNNATFSASVGDANATVLTGCAVPPLASSCQTPATFFYEEPAEEFAAIMNLFSSRNRLRLDLYLGSNLVDSETGNENVIVQTDL